MMDVMDQMVVCGWTPAATSLSLSLPGRLLRRHWLPVYDNEPQLHHHWLDYRFQQRQQRALNTTLHFTGFTLSVVTFPVFLLNDCQCQCYPAWAERTFSPTHVTPLCPFHPDERASRLSWKANNRFTKTDHMHRVTILEAVPCRFI